uniref:Reverse transcriptase/retrotransposon-derived protein RNase H-like domain-containing protein n=1 Tax=Maylandia zebra TaxID=106582 RepID=A0A3P9BH57_9CICH
MDPWQHFARPAPAQLPAVSYLEKDPEMTASFNALKGALTSAPCLGLPDYHLPFHLYVTENGTTCTGVLAQEHGSGYRPVAFYSKVLPVVVQGMPACLRAVAACSIMIRDCEKITCRNSP